MSVCHFRDNLKREVSQQAAADSCLSRFSSSTCFTAFPRRSKNNSNNISLLDTVRGVVEARGAVASGSHEI